MAKISGLPVAAQLTGAEHLPVVQAGATKRATLAAFRDMIVPFLQNWYKGDRGDVGEAANTFSTKARLRALDPVKYPSAILVDRTRPPVVYAYVEGDFRGQADGDAVVALDNVALSSGALVRQSSDDITFDARRNARQRMELDVFVTDTRFAGGAVGNALADDTAAFLACAAFCEAIGGRMRIPCGTYKLTDTIPMRRSFSVVGDGTEQTILNMVSDTIKPVFEIKPSNNVIILGIRFSDMQIRCNGGSERCEGIIARTAPTNSTIRQCHFDNLWIRDTRRGLWLSGVVYRNFFTNITVQGASDHGIYADVGFVDVTYNTFYQIEVTNVANGAYAYYIRSSNSSFDMLTSDGVAYFSSPGGTLSNYKLETLQADVFPEAMGPAALKLNQMQIVKGATCIGVTPAKRTHFMWVIGRETTITGTRFTPPQPLNPFFLEPGSTGVIGPTYMEGTLSADPAVRTKRLIEDSHTDEVMNGWTFHNATDITRRSTVNRRGSWTPSFSTEWTVVPSEVSATYRCDGSKVMHIVTGRGGKCTAGARIGGAPVMHNTVGIGRLVAPGLESACSMIVGNPENPESSDFLNFRACDIPAGDYWQLIVEAGA